RGWRRSTAPISGWCADAFAPSTPFSRKIKWSLEVTRNGGNPMSTYDQFFWLIYPYLMLTLFVVGHIYRYNTDTFGWSAKSSEFLEMSRLRWGSLLFHWGIIFVFFGHVAGILVPKGFYEAVGITEEMYHF